jgi:hypothetical protein
VIIKIIFLFSRAFIYVAYPAYTFNLYIRLDAQGNMGQLWISAILSVIGVYFLIQRLEKYLRDKNMWPS